jgi:hypothetical protein
VLLHEVVKNGRWAVVVDPAVARSRVWLINSVPTYILTIAKRISDAPVFGTFPQQSDYVTLWQGGALQSSGKSAKPSLLKEPVARLKRLGQRIRSRPRDRLVPPFFREVSEEDVLLGRFATSRST